MELIRLFNEFLSINLKDYPNIDIDLEIGKILFCFTIALIIATVVINYIRIQTNSLIKKLIRYEAIEEDKAKTLEELGIKLFNAKIAFFAKGKTDKIIFYQGQKEYTYEEYSELIKSKDFKEEKIDFKNAKFYIKPDQLDRAKKIIDQPTTSVVSLILLCVLIFVIFICILLLLPGLLNFLNNNI